jgi:MFS family permease
MVFRTLRYRNFRIFFFGQSISLIGTWIQHIAMSWLVYRITNSPFMLGLVGFSSQIPAFILSPFAGVLADRHNRHRILLLTQTLAMLQAFMIAGLAITGNIKVWQIIIMGIFLGCVNSLEIPARHSFILEMIEEKEGLGNAIALNSMMFNIARLIGPSIAGILIALTGEGVCFLINGISYFAVIGSLLAMKISNRKGKTKHDSVIKDLKDGFNYAFGFLPIRAVLFLLGIVSLLGMSYAVLMPVFARDILHGGPQTLGFLMGAVGIGSLAGTIYLAARSRVIMLGNILPLSAGMFGLSIIVFSFSHNLLVSLAVLFFAGFGLMVQMASSNTILQTIVDDDKRGRIMSFYTMAFMGMAPLGSLLAGALASKIGVLHTLVISGAFCIIAAIIFAFRIPVLKRNLTL